MTDTLPARARAFLGSLRSQALDPFLAEWPPQCERRAVVASSLPVLRWLSGLEAAAPACTLELVSELCRAAERMPWRQTYEVREVGSFFLENYGWAETVGLSGELASERIACGFLLMGPRTPYPAHQHEAEEIYVPLSGVAAWQKGDERWCERVPGSVIHHARHEPHSMRTASSPLLALYLWRSDNLQQKSRLVPHD